MTRIRTAVAIALAGLGIAAAPAPANDYWREPDGGPNPINVSGDLGLGPEGSNLGGFDLEDRGGTPHVAWSEWDGQVRKVRVARLQGGQWTQVGSELNANPAGDAHSPSLAMNGGTLWATWLERDVSGALIVRVARLDGTTWVPVGGAVDVYPLRGPWSPGGQYEAGQSQLAFLNGVPHLGVLEDDSTEYQFTLLRLDGGSWVKLTARGPRPFFISRAFDLEVSGGRLYIDGGSFSGYGVVWRLAADSSQWEDVGLPDRAEAVGGLTDVGGVLHTVFTATHDSGAPEGIAVARLVGGTWEEVGPYVAVQDPGGGFSRRPGAVVAIGNVPHLLIDTQVDQEPVQRELGVVRLSHDASSWDPVGSGWINHSLDVRGALLAGVAGVPYVAWSEFDGCNYDLRVARLERASADDPPLPPPGPCPPPAPPQDPPGEGDPPGGDPPGNGPGGPGGDEPGGDGPDPGPPPTGACGLLLEGTGAPDGLRGAGGRDEISGLGGNDRIWGLGHADCLFGGVGNDMLDGGTGNDELHGEAGHDRLKGGGDSDELFGGIGNDRLTGNDDEDELVGGAGNDVLAGGDGYDTVSGGAGNDVIDARGAGFDRIDCGSGRDRVKHATRRSDRLRGCERVSYGG